MSGHFVAIVCCHPFSVVLIALHVTCCMLHFTCPIVKKRNVSRKRISVRIVGEFVDVLVPPIQEKIFEVIQHIPQERISERNVEHTTSVSVPQTQEHIVAAVKDISRESAQQCSVGQFVDAPVPQISNVPVPPTLEEILEVIQPVPQARFSEGVIEQMTSVPPPQTQADSVKYRASANSCGRIHCATTRRDLRSASRCGRIQCSSAPRQRKPMWTNTALLLLPSSQRPHKSSRTWRQFLCLHRRPRSRSQLQSSAGPWT